MGLIHTCLRESAILHASCLQYLFLILKGFRKVAPTASVGRRNEYWGITGTLAWHSFLVALVTLGENRHGTKAKAALFFIVSAGLPAFTFPSSIGHKEHKKGSIRGDGAVK
jgi:hypothetical protein